MAKIKQKKMRLGLDPKRPHQETVINICYDSTDRRTESYRRPIPSKRFYIKLPQVVADALDETDVRGNDQEDVVKLFEDAIERFKSLKKEVNWVILYDIKVGPHPNEEKKKDYWYSRSGIEIRVWAGTYQETVAIAGDGVRRFSYEYIESLVNFPGTGKDGSKGPTDRDGLRYDRQVPWTEQNEAFFVWIKERMTDLVAHLAALQEPDTLIESISAGRLLPFGGSSQEINSVRIS